MTNGYVRTAAIQPPASLREISVHNAVSLTGNAVSVVFSVRLPRRPIPVRAAVKRTA